LTTVIDFAPSNSAPFQFQATLDNSNYTAIVTWNLAGQRYYVNLYSLAGDLIFCLPLISSPSGLQIQIASWFAGKALITTAVPHGYKVGSTLFLTLAGFTPDAWNGLKELLVVSPAGLQFLVSSDPGTVSVFGSINFDISMTAGYFTSTLVYREANAQFEITP
jgi:hypothetical protein